MGHELSAAAVQLPALPVVQGRSALWDEGDEHQVVVGTSIERREVLLTTTLDAQPDSRESHPHDSIWPLLMAIAIGVLFITAIFTPLGLPIGGVLAFIAFAGWAWPTSQDVERRAMRGCRWRAHDERERVTVDVAELPTVVFGQRGLLWWGTWASRWPRA